MRAVASRSRGRRSAPPCAFFINVREGTFQNGSFVLLMLCLSIFISSQESHQRAQREKVESLDEDQLFVAELARDLERVCQVPAWERDQSTSGWEQSANNVETRSLSSVSPLQRSAVLEHIWKQDDIWPSPLCRTFILQWASVLESKEVCDICGLLVFSSPLLTKVCVSEPRRGLCRQTDGQRWMSSSRLDWLLSRMPSRPNLRSSTGSRT